MYVPDHFPTDAISGSLGVDLIVIVQGYRWSTASSHMYVQLAQLLKSPCSTILSKFVSYRTVKDNTLDVKSIIHNPGLSEDFVSELILLQLPGGKTLTSHKFW